jgi:hypothetical protein
MEQYKIQENMRKCTVCYEDKPLSYFHHYVYKGASKPRAMCKACNLKYCKNKRIANKIGVKSLPNEIWKDVLGYEGRYMVSSFGRVKSLQRVAVSNFEKAKRLMSEKLISSLGSRGYKTVCLTSKEGGERVFKVHRLVCNAFIENKYKKPMINHINGIKTDNRVENLEWCDNSENQRHAILIGLRKTKTNGLYLTKNL